ncbi:MAG: response regulator, partial [Planctomycetota bacterium]
IMPGLEGLEMIRRLRHRAPDVPIVAISGGGRMPACGYLQMASKLGAVQTLAKPFARNEFIEVLTRAMQDAALV